MGEIEWLNDIVPSLWKGGPTKSMSQAEWLTDPSRYGEKAAKSRRIRQLAEKTEGSLTTIARTVLWSQQEDDENYGLVQIPLALRFSFYYRCMYSSKQRIEFHKRCDC